MRDLDTLTYHPLTEKIVEVLCKKTQNNKPEFFRILLSYYLAKVAASMRVKIATKDRGEIPVNLYAINLASSGHGKGYSTNIIEEELLHLFKSTLMSDTLPIISENSLSTLAAKRAVISGEEEEVVLEAVQKEFRDLGELAFSFDSGTPAAIKQMRHKLLMANIGAVNFEMDELGSNILGSTEALNTFLELFDVGKIKQKLTKNTKENTRSKEIDGRTPTNLLMFGTPSKLFDGSKVEDEFYSLMETGYARRCLFGYSRGTEKNKVATPEEIYNDLTDTTVKNFMRDMAIHFSKLANIINHNKVLEVSKAVSILIIEYRLYCERIAEAMGEHQDIAKAEISHRYFKALKLAGIYAFIDGDHEVTKDNFYHAVCMVEESGKAFKKILARDRPYVKLAKYIGIMEGDVTHVDLAVDLPFFKGSASVKAELLQMAAAWGHKNHIIIKKTLSNGIEFIKGETLKETNLDKMILSHSHDIADGYQNVVVKWEDLHKFTQQQHKHWINHYSTTGHRSEECMIKGFNMIALDVDDGSTPVQACMKLLKDYKFFIHTTKRHTDIAHRYRIIFPLNYHMELSPSDYRMFMRNVYEWIPFDLDAGTVDRCRKWLTHDGQCSYSTGKRMLDARLFIPKTAKNDEQKAFVATYQSMSNMERWFLTNSSNGNRNKQLLRYAMMLVDLGYDENSVQDATLEMNNKFPDKLTEKEILNTIMVSVVKKILKQSDN